MRQLYLAATGQNRGKTTAALGLFDGFVQQGLRAGFMKPVGQRTVIDDGVPADEDAVLMRAAFELPEAYSVLSPVHIPRGFTKAFIAGEGGVGRPIDEIVLNAALFARHGVPVAGAIVNKVDVEAQPGIRRVLE